MSSKRPTKCTDCPVRVRISGPGVASVRSADLVRCCRVQWTVQRVRKLLEARDE